MAEIVLFHHAGGLTDGVVAFAQTLRVAGHTVQTPDLFEGRTFADVHDGVAYAESVGEETFAARATELVLARPGARGTFFLYGAIAPSWWGTTWPAGVPSQAHVTESDEWREPDAEAEYVAQVPGAELFVYPGSGHLFAEPDHPDHDEEAAHVWRRAGFSPSSLPCEVYCCGG